MIVSSYVIKFMIFSFMGWVYECIYCSITTRHWDNRGFLIGPICPIYGIGAVTAMVIFNELPYFSGAETPWWKIFLICALGSAVLEYSVSLILEKKFHAMWWDYSNVPFNIKGRVCLPATLGFGVAGVIIVKMFFPWFMEHTQEMAYHPLVNEVMALLFIMVLGMDLALSVASITELLDYLDNVQERFDEKMEASVEMVASAPGVIKEKVSEAPEVIKVKMSEAPEAIKEKMSEAPEAIKEKMSEAPEAIKEKMSEVMKLNPGQKHHLRNIKTYKPKKNTGLFERLKKELKDNDKRGH